MVKKHLNYDETAEGDAADEHRKDMLRCIERLVGYTQGPYVQLLAGNEGMYNPLPIFWLGRSPVGSGLLMGLVSGVVWT